MTEVRWDPVTVAVVALLVALIPMVAAQPVQLIVDPTGDTAIRMQGESQNVDLPEADITSVSAEHDDDTGEIRFLLEIDANLDPTGPPYQRAILERLGYGVWWTGSNGSQWGFYAAPNALPNNDLTMGLCEDGRLVHGADEETGVALVPGETSEITWTVDDFKVGAWDFSDFLSDIYASTWQTVTDTDHLVQTAPRTCDRSVHSNVDRAPDAGFHDRFETGG